MNADDILNAKAEVFTKAFGFSEVPSAYGAGSHPSFAAEPGTEAANLIHRGLEDGRRDARDLIALGMLLPGDNSVPGGGTLAVLVQKQRLLQHPLVEAAVRAAKGEARVIYTGGVRRFGGPGLPRSRPLRIGDSVAHYRVTAGTLGCFVIKRQGGGIGILSNNHVLANTNRATIGDTILQPGKVDGGQIRDAADHVAQLHHFVPINFGSGAINRVDAAYALLMHGIGCSAGRVGEIGPDDGAEWAVGPVEDLLVTAEGVKKWGRTTRFTRGLVAAIAVDNLRVNFQFGNVAGSARFDGQISISGRGSRFSEPGDSGSLIATEDGRSVGLLFAGSEAGGADGGGLTFATPIDTVLDELDIDIYTGA